MPRKERNLLSEAVTPASPPDEIRVSDNRELERYELHVGDVVAGFATYRLHPGRITFLHTETEPEYEGRGLGGHLAAAVLDDARRRGLSVTPICPFIASWIKRHPGYLDLVKAWPPSGED